MGSINTSVNTDLSCQCMCDCSVVSANTHLKSSPVWTCEINVALSTSSVKVQMLSNSKKTLIIATQYTHKCEFLSLYMITRLLEQLNRSNYLWRRWLNTPLLKNARTAGDKQHITAELRSKGKKCQINVKKTLIIIITVLLLLILFLLLLCMNRKIMFANFSEGTKKLNFVRNDIFILVEVK